MIIYKSKGRAIHKAQRYTIIELICIIHIINVLHNKNAQWLNGVTVQGHKGTMEKRRGDGEKGRKGEFSTARPR